MDWYFNNARLNNILNILKLSTDTEAQALLAKKTDEAKLDEENCCYFAFIFGNSINEPITIRQLAGIIVKNWICHIKNINIINYVKFIVMGAIQNENEIIRNTAGNIITSILLTGGCDSWPEILDTLLNLIQTSINVNIVKSTFLTIKKIAEDELEFVNDSIYRNEKRVEDNAFMKFSNEKLLPLLISIILRKETPLEFSCIIMSILLVYCQNNAFAEGEFGSKFIDSFLIIIGRFASCNDVNMKILIVKAISSIFDFDSARIEANQKGIIEYILACSCDSNYDLRFNALNFWTEIFRENSFTAFIESYLPTLIPIVFSNLIYSDYDLVDMDESQLIDDDNLINGKTNVNLAERYNNIEPKSYSRTIDNYGDDEEDDNDYKATWGSYWTARKAAGLTLDLLSTIYKSKILPIALPIIQEKLTNNTNWLERETGILAIGAISKGCIKDLAQFLPNLIGLLLNLTNDKKPLIRSIACWAISRFSDWICLDGDGRYIEPTVYVLLNHIVDFNKGVQDAACSAFAVFIESAAELLIPFLPKIFECFLISVRTFQTRNLVVLYETIGTLATSLNSDFIPASSKNIYDELIDHLIKTFESSSAFAYETSCLCECLGSILSATNTMQAPYVQIILKKCNIIIVEHYKELKQFIQQNQDANKVYNTDVMECCFDLIGLINQIFGSSCSSYIDDTDLLYVIDYILSDIDHEKYKYIVQNTLSLLGDMQASHYVSLAVKYDKWIPLICNLLYHSTWTVYANSVWCIGQIVQNCDAEIIKTYIPLIVNHLKCFLNFDSIAHQGRRNGAITLGRICAKYPNEVAPVIQDLASSWLKSFGLSPTHIDEFKGFLGLVAVMKLQPIIAKNYLPKIKQILSTYYKHVVEKEFNEELRLNYKEAWLWVEWLEQN